MKKTFTECLPRKNTKIDWQKSEGCVVNFIYGDIIDNIKILKYDIKTKKLQIKYNKNIFHITPNALKQCNLGCVIGKYNHNHLYKINEIINGLQVLDNIRVRHGRGTEKGYRYKCIDCGYIGSTSETHLKDGMQCPVCKGNHKICVKEINSVWKTHPHLLKYFVNIEDAYNYTYSSYHKVLLKCPICNYIKKMPIGNLTFQGFGCNRCGDNISYPQKFMFNILEQLSIKFKTEYNPYWIKPKRYDFYFELNNEKYIIEMDGGLGHGKGVHSLSKQTAEESRAIDDYKDKLANKHGIKVIRIDCDKSDLEYIKNNILNSRLFEIFDLSNINWNKVEEFALSNFVKKACEIKRDNPDMTTTEIGKIMKSNKSTIKEYLIKGSKIWDWINYNPKEEMQKSAAKCGKKNSKPILCYKNGILIGEFSSATYLAKISKDALGIELKQTSIRNYCILNDKNKQYKGYSFQYVGSDIN